MSDAITGESFAKFVGFGLNAQDVQRALFEHSDADSVEVRLNSPGGSVFEGAAIFNALAADSRDIQVRVTGLAASVASTVAQAGDEIIMEPGSMMMIHEPRLQGSIDAEADDLRSKADMLDKMTEAHLDILDRATGESSTREELRAAMAAETWLTGPEAVDMGLASGVGTSQASPSDAQDAVASARDDLWHARRGTVLAAYRNAPAEARLDAPLGWRGPTAPQLVAAMADAQASSQTITAILSARAATPPPRKAQPTGGHEDGTTVSEAIKKMLGLAPDANEADVEAAMLAQQTAHKAALAIEKAKAAASAKAAEATAAAAEMTSHQAKVDDLAKRTVKASRELVVGMCWMGEGDERAPYPAGLKSAEGLLAENPSMRVDSYTRSVAEIRTEEQLKGTAEEAANDDLGEDLDHVMWDSGDGQTIDFTRFTGMTAGAHKKKREEMHARARALPKKSALQRQVIAAYEGGK